MLLLSSFILLQLLKATGRDFHGQFALRYEKEWPEVIVLGLGGDGMLLPHRL